MVEIGGPVLLEHVGKSPSKFNLDKLLYLNAHYIKMAEPERIASLLVPFLAKRGIDAKPSPWLTGAVRTLLERSRTSRRWPKPRNTTSARSRPIRKRRRSSSHRRSPGVLEIAEAFSALDDFSADREDALKKVVERHGGNLKVHQPIRVALTGGTASPGLFEVMEILGRDEVVRRLRAAAGRIGA